MQAKISNQKCTLGLGSESMLIKKPNPSWCSRVCRELCKLFMVSEYHPLIFDYFRSYPALVDERRRYVAEHRNVIHPLSIFSLIWKSLMIFLNLAHLIISTLRFCILVSDPASMSNIDKCDIMVFVLQNICFIDMIVCFNMGFLESESALIELSRKKITRAYFLSYWLPDVLSWIPVSYFMLVLKSRNRYDMLIPDMLPLARCVRIITVLDDLKTLLRTMVTSHIWYRGIRHILLVALAVHCLTCLLYLPSCYAHYVYGKVPIGYTGFLDIQNVSRVFYDLSPRQRYKKGMFVAASAFFSTGFSMFQTYHRSEILVNSFIMLFGAMFQMYSVVFWLKTYMTLYNSTLRYEELLDQVEKFMKHHQFPAPLMRRLRDYYRYTFQEHYYKESVGLGYLSAQLQNEIRLHSHYTLVDRTPVLQDLPPSFLGRVLACLEQEVHMPDDMIFHVGDFTKHVYFIATGTLVLYTGKGAEAMHFQDGDMIGGLALLTKDTRRVTTLVAIEITHTYRLSFKDLRELNKVDMELFKRIQKYTFERYKNYKDIVNFDELNLVKETPLNKD